MVLPKGVTGFFVPNSDEAPPSEIDPKLFTGACYTAAQALNTQIVGVDATLHPARNFYVAEIQAHHQHLWIMCNVHFPFIAFAADRPDWYGHPFIDVPEFAAVFVQTYGFDVLPSMVLEASPTPQTLLHLTPVEHQHVHAWKARRIGDIIFNHWD